MSYEACMMDLTQKGVSPAGAARACAIAVYQETGLLPGSKGLEKVKIDVSKQAERIATQYSLMPEMPKTDWFRVESQEAFSFDQADIPNVDIFSPMMIEEKGYKPRLMREVFLIRTGEFNGIPFTEDDLQALVDNWEGPIPFQIDHSTAWKDNVGNLLSVKRVGKKVFGLCEFIGWEAIDYVQTGDAKVSIGFFLKPRKLFEVSLTRFPAVGGKDPARVLPPPLKKKQQPMLSSTESEQKETQPLQTPDCIKPESATLDTSQILQGGQAPEKGNQMPPEVTPPAAPAPSFSESAVLAQMNKQLADLEAKFAKAEQEKAILSQQVESANGILKLQRNTQMVVEFAQKGLMLTANKDLELEFISSLSDEMIEKYAKIKEANGPVIALGKLSAVEDRAPGEPVSQQDLESKKARLKANYLSAQAELSTKKH